MQARHAKSQWRPLKTHNKGNEINSMSLGKTLASFDGRIENRLRLKKIASHKNAVMWRVVKVER